MSRHFNPQAHRPRTQRLRIGVRGASGTRKSTFAASLAEAGLGKLCFFDTELKSCHIPGHDGSRFDAYELSDPDELPAAIHWALHEPEGRAEGYGCYVLDSWNQWFAPKYAEFLEAKRVETGRPYPELDGADLQRLQVACGEVLRPLCIESKACVVITDTIAGKGLEEKAANEVGRIVPISASGLEYLVDLLVEAELRLADDGLSEVCVHRVVKSNNQAFPIGLVLRNPSFKDYLLRLGAPNVATAETIKAESAEVPMLTVVPPAAPSREDLLSALLDKVAQLGFSVENLVGAANRDFGKTLLAELSADEIARLDERLEAAHRRGASPVAAPLPAARKARA